MNILEICPKFTFVLYKQKSISNSINLLCNQYGFACSKQYLRKIFSENVFLIQRKHLGYSYVNSIFAYITVNTYSNKHSNNTEPFFFFNGLRICVVVVFIFIETWAMQSTISQCRIELEKTIVKKIRFARNQYANKQKKHSYTCTPRERKRSKKKVMCFDRVNICLSIKFMIVVLAEKCSCCCFCS